MQEPSYKVTAEYGVAGVAFKKDSYFNNLAAALAVADSYAERGLTGYHFGRVEITRNGRLFLGLEPEMVNRNGAIVDSGKRRWHAMGEDCFDPA